MKFLNHLFGHMSIVRPDHRFLLAVCLGLLGFASIPFVHADETQANDGNACKVTSFTSVNEVNSAAISRLTDAAKDLSDSVPGLYPSRFNYCLGEREQYSWTNVPGSRSGGIRLGDLSADQQDKVWQLLQNFLSESAFDNVHFLAAILEEASGAGPLGNYTIAMFGTPGTDSAWGFQFDGHHIALNFVVDSNHVILAPAFLGSRPTTVDGVTPLAEEIKTGREFISQLTDAQRESAFVPKLVQENLIVGSGRGQIDQGVRYDVTGFDQVGLPYPSLTETQQAQFRGLVASYVNRLHADFSKDSVESIEKHLDSGYFVYSTRDDQIYYRVYVKDAILIEYSDVGSDHVHTVVRLLGSRPFIDYGGFVVHKHGSRSIITNHLLTAEHHKKDVAEILANSH